MFSSNRISIFKYLLFQYTKREKPLTLSSSSSSLKPDWTMKNLIDSKQYRKALDVFDRQLEMSISNNYSISLALKACTKLSDYERGIQIHRQIPPELLNNSFVQASLIHFYSK